MLDSTDVCQSVMFSLLTPASLDRYRLAGRPVEAPREFRSGIGEPEA